MGELELIAAIEEALGGSGGRLLRGPGDDAAVVRAAPVAVTSVDTLVEGVHFDLRTHSHGDVGHKALAASLSDIAAMGARPGEAYVALVLGGRTDRSAALALVEAMEALAARTGTRIAGGDVVAGPALSISVTVTGWAEHPDHLAYRDGARAGDLVGVSGELGGSGAGLELLRGLQVDLPPAERDALILRHRRPEPRLALGGGLAAAGATAMIDLSDGVATDAGHIAMRSEVELEVRLAGLPLGAGVAEVARAANREPAELAATAGEDFELLLTAPPESSHRIEQAADAAAARITWIGAVTHAPSARGPGARLLRRDGSAARLSGYEHRLSGGSVPPSEPDRA